MKLTLEQFKAWGRKGGKKTASMHTAKDYEKWGKMGGRPRKKNNLNSVDKGRG